MGKTTDDSSRVCVSSFVFSGGGGAQTRADAGLVFFVLFSRFWVFLV